jgi:antitoxin CptB
MTQQNRIERLRYRSWHRGTREMDLLMGSFADANLSAFTPAQLDEYEAILQEIDPDLYNWIAGIEALPPDKTGEVWHMLCTHHFAKKSG